MTLESGKWPSHHNQPLPQEKIKTSETTHEEKCAHLVAAAFDRILYLATDRRGLPQINGDIEDFDLSTVLVPRRHMPGNIREGLFTNGLWLRATTAGPLTDSLHSLLLYTDGRPHRYYVVGLNVDSEVNSKVNDEADPEDDDGIVGIEEIAAIPNVLYDFGKIESTFEIERSNRWPRALTPGDLTVAHASRNKPD